MKYWLISILIFLTTISCDFKGKVHPNAQLLTELSDSSFVDHIIEEQKIEYTGDSIIPSRFEVLGLAQETRNDFQLILKNNSKNPFLLMDFFSSCACIHIDYPTLLFDIDNRDTLAFTFSTAKTHLPDFTDLKLYGNSEPIESNITLDLRKIKLSEK